MALKAGYVGVKRYLYEALTKESAENKQGVANLWSVNGVLGAKNLLKHTIPGKTDAGVTWTYGSNGEVIANSDGAATGVSSFNESVSLKAGKYFISGCPANGSDTTYIIRITTGTPSATAIAWDKGEGVAVTLESDVTLYVQSQIRSGYTATNVTFKPMIRFIEDPNNDYVPYAATNAELTTEVSSINTDLESHKTEINAIISAATGAADFAAFKTAMEALTPLTRTAPQEETRSIEPEIDEEVTVKKTTKKTTKKEVE